MNTTPMAGGQFRYVTPVRPQDATGRVARVYARLADDFGMARMAVFLTLSPAPAVLAGTWALLRESLLAGPGSRTGREVVALGVSLANRCPFCVAAHTTLLHATGDHRLAETVAAGGVPEDPGHAALLRWAKDRRAPAPFPADQAPGYVGTALTFHFVNRIASALLTENLLPGNLQKSRLVRSVGGRAMSRTVRRELPPGAGLDVLDGLPASAGPAWAAGSPVGTAYATLMAVAEAGGELLGEAARTAVTEAVAAWDGEHPPMGGDLSAGPLTGVPAAERPGARLALLTALAPYRITDPDVAAWHATAPTAGYAAGYTDGDLVRLIAFGAATATRHQEARLTGAHAEPGGAALG